MSRGSRGARNHLKRGQECSCCGEFFTCVKEHRELGLFICKACYEAQSLELSNWNQPKTKASSNNMKVAVKKKRKSTDRRDGAGEEYHNHNHKLAAARRDDHHLTNIHHESSRGNKECSLPYIVQYESDGAENVIESLCASSTMVQYVLANDVMCDSSGILKSITYARKELPPKKILDMSVR
jgi:hypothetical protein